MDDKIRTIEDWIEKTEEWKSGIDQLLTEQSQSRVRYEEKIDEIHEVLLGNNKYKKVGIIQQHNEMYEYYRNLKANIVLIKALFGASALSAVIGLLNLFRSFGKG